jgi:glucose-6-phosphate 1-dehydrogenase
VIFFRFANSIFEPLWNRKYIDNVQITVSEDMGIEHRGNFYEESGIIRDIVQNHMLQLIALTAMEAPVGFDADFIRDEKVKVYNSMREMKKSMLIENIVLGQYDKDSNNDSTVKAYREEKDVSPQSTVPTFFAAKFFIDNWRWSGVPFYVRTGKRLKKKITEICIEFKHPPLRLFGDTCRSYDPNLLFITIQPENEISFNIGIKYPNKINAIQPVQMKFNYKDFFGPSEHPAYERLILDCIKGDLSLFAREDGIKAMWDIVDPIIQHYENNASADFPNYSAGSWGPDSSNELLNNDGRIWHTL